MIPLVISLVVAAALIGGVIWAMKALKTHSTKWAELTAARGFDLEFHAAGFLDMPFDIVQRVSDRSAWTQISRRDSDDRTFLYKFEVGEDEQRERRTCTLVELDVDAPHTTIRPHALQTAPPGPADGADVTISPAAFAEVFRVQSADPSFASELLTVGFTNWLLTPEARVGTVEFELRGRWLLAIAPKVASAEALMDFHEWGQHLRRQLRPAAG